MAHLLRGSRHKEGGRSQKGPYLGAVLGPVPPQVAVQVTLKNTGAVFEMSPQMKTPGMAWVTEVTGRVGILAMIQSFVPSAVVVIYETAQV